MKQKRTKVSKRIKNKKKEKMKLKKEYFKNKNEKRKLRKGKFPRGMGKSTFWKGRFQKKEKQSLKNISKTKQGKWTFRNKKEDIKF